MNKVLFNGASKIISVQNNVTELTVLEIYSAWKDWMIISDNAKYYHAFSVLGGDPTVSGKYLGTTFFLENGWKIKPYGWNHVLTIIGNLYSRDGSSPMVPCDGNFNVLVNLTTSNLIDTVSTAGGSSSNVTVNDIVSSIMMNLQDYLTRIVELHLVHGLDENAPLNVTQTGRVAGNINQQFIINTQTKSTAVKRNK